MRKVKIDNKVRKSTELKQNGFKCKKYDTIEAEGGEFIIYDELGKGGNGKVYLVQAISGIYKGGLFALKVLYKLSDEERLRKFWAEQTLLKELSHPNLMQFIDEGVYKGQPFLVQPYMPKILRDKLNGRALPFGKALVFSCQLLSALQALHVKGILHRDIKPGNIFIDGLFVQLGDFGLIKKLDGIDKVDKKDFRGYWAGPVRYPSPELVAYANGRGKLTLASDIFQAGLVIAEMFSGRNPFNKGKPIEEKGKQKKNVTKKDIKLPTEKDIKGKCANDIVNLIGKMLIIKPKNRISINDALNDFIRIFEKYEKACCKLHGEIVLYA